MADHDERTGPWRTDLIDWPSPMREAMLRACAANPNGLIATTIPLGELREFCQAFADALGVRGASAVKPEEGIDGGQQHG